MEIPRETKGRNILTSFTFANSRPQLPVSGHKNVTVLATEGGYLPHRASVPHFLDEKAEVRWHFLYLLLFRSPLDSE